MRIAHFVDTEFFGGAEQVIVDLSAEALRRGDEPVLFHLGHAELAARIEELGVPQRFLPKEPEYRSKRTLHHFVRAFRRVLDEEGIQVLHSHLFGSVFAGALATVGTSVRHVGTLHDSYTFIDRPAFRHAVTLCDVLGTAVVAVSPSVRDAARPGGLLPRASVEVIENGLSIPERPADVHLAELVQGAGLNPSRVTVAVVARLVPIKGIDILLTAWARAAPTDAQLAIVGDGPEMERLTRMVEDLGLTGDVHFLGFRRDVSELLFASDAFVLPSYSEGLSCSLLEAMAHGLPSVATDVGGNPRLIVPGETGILVPSGDPEALADGLVRMISDEATRTSLGEAARARVDEHFSARATCDAYWRLYGA